MAAYPIATISLEDSGNLLKGALPYSMLTTSTSNLFANAAQNPSSNSASQRAKPPPCTSRDRGRSSPALWDLGIKIRFRKCGRHGYALTIVGRSAGCRPEQPSERKSDDCSNLQTPESYEISNSSLGWESWLQERPGDRV